jgi:hypothetical protein
MRHCGVAVQMEYGIGSTGGSGAFTISSNSPVRNCMEYALKTYFGYKSSLSGIRRSNYTTTAWTNLLKSELDGFRPVLYAGHGTGGGHSFVCDGYDNNGFFHFNLGWGGNSDGYFQLNALNPAALGAGGGSGGYNSGQDMIIGVEPDRPPASANIGLFNSLNVAPSTISRGGSFSVTTNFVNPGPVAFTGDFCVGVFSGNTYIGIVEIKTGYTLAVGTRFANNITFNSNGIAAMVSGTYQLYAYYRPQGTTNWKLVANNGALTNYATIDVGSTSDINLYTAINLASSNYNPNSALTAYLSIVNTSTLPFYGNFDLDVYDQAGAFVKTLSSKTNMSLCANCYYNPNLVFSTSDIDLTPGTYNVVVSYQPSGGTWSLVGNGNFLNSATIVVSQIQLQPDRYENNNTIASATPSTISWANNQDKLISTGTNFHLGTDVDYFRINLPTGYNYTLNPRIQDSYSANDGNTYTVDALFSYTTDNGATFSSSYDDVLASPIVLQGGTTIVFKAAPYFVGKTGTYVLEIPITRSPAIGITNSLVQSDWKIAPNPAQEFIMVEGVEAGQLNLLNTNGQLVGAKELIEGSNRIELLGLPTGVYMVRITTKSGTEVKRLVIR